MSTQRHRIAIIGMGVLFPGADSVAAFWDNLTRGVKSTTPATAHEFGVDPAVFVNPDDPDHDTTYFAEGGYVRAQLADADPRLDDPFNWSLHAARAALADAGYSSADLSRAGLVLGNLSFPTQYSHRLAAPIYDEALAAALAELLHLPALRLPALNDTPADGPDARNLHVNAGPASYVAQTLGLGAAHYAIDAACASSLYAVGLACLALQSGQADLMLAGAVNGADPLFVNMGFNHFGAYPRRAEENRPLDANSGGLINGQGAGVFVLKRYADALRDGDRVHAVIAGVGLANDGRGKHPLTPNPAGQILAYQRAYTDIDPADVQYVECHTSGTPLGDRTEINAMAEFFSAHGSAPLIGAVKSNVGHLLTAAGMASLTKAILSMQHGLIPGTVGVQQPMASQDGHFGAAQIVTQNTPFPHAATRRVGVNAFGFGGVSAHIVLEAAPPTPPHTHTQRTNDIPMTDKAQRLAIVGMDAHFGACDGLAEAVQTFYTGRQHFRELPEKRWEGLRDSAPTGAYIDGFELDFMRHKLPPKDDNQPIPQQLLLLKVADNAVRDAGLSEDSNVAVIVALGAELSLHQFRGRLDLTWQIKAALDAAGITLSAEETRALTDIAKDALNPQAQVNQYTSYIGNIICSRISALWNFSGPAFTLSAEENSTARALETARLLLDDPSIEAVVVGAVDLAGGVENVVRRAQQFGPAAAGTPTLSFDENAAGWLIGEGAGAVVLKRADDSLGKQKVYATLDGMSIAPNVQQAADTALSQAGIGPAQVGVIEASASGFAAEDQAEAAALNAVYRDAGAASIALGSAKANVGHSFNAAGMAGLVKAALMLYHRFLPATPNWSGPKADPAWQDSPFYVLERGKTWFAPNGVRRAAALSSLGADGTAAHLVLGEADHAADTTYLKHQDAHLYLIDADNEAGLMGRLGQLEAALNDTPNLALLAARSFQVYRGAAYVLGLVAADAESLRREISAARSGLRHAFESGRPYQTPAGSYFTPRPVGDKGGVAFVYPGAFNSYPDLGRDWLQLFPQAHDHLHTLTSDPGGAVADPLLYARTLRKPDRAAIKAIRRALVDDQTAMMESGTTFAILFTYVMRELFKVKPSAAFGYSIGEGSMLWAMGVWRDGDSARERFAHSPLFTTRLFGRKEAVRAMWSLPPHASDDFWASYVLSAPRDTVAAAVADASRVYITHVNTPDETVIAGDPAACERVIEGLEVRALRAPFETVIHNEAMISEFDEFFRVHNNTLSPAHQDVTFYSAADYAPIHLDQESIARNIARVSCKQVDFPRLVNRVYRDGARVFIELGPGSTVARWVSDSLGDREHLAVSIDTMRGDTHGTLLKMLARLASHRVPMDLSPLYCDPSARESERKLMRRVELGGTPIRDVILSAENQQRFGGHAVQAAPAQPTPAPVQTPADDYAAQLQSRMSALEQIAAQITAQMQGGTASMPTPAPITPQRPVIATPPNRFTPRPPVFDTWKIDQFARGSIAACFGPEYAIYDTKRAPRIPNTDLMLVSRAVQIDAERLVTKVGSRLVMEYDVPADAWFYVDNSYPFTPYSVLMEMALQPCGFLSAFMGPTFEFPDVDFYFRNLDGHGALTHEPDLRGRTLTNTVTLLTSTTLQGIIIQKYSFDMVLDGQSFYTGESTFGYFTKEALASQAGLDMGRPPQKWHTANPHAALRPVMGSRQQPAPHRSFMELPDGMLAFVDDAQIAPQGGTAGLGYVYARSRVHPDDWFFRCHFHQDPVMPGSLGLETVTQAVQLIAIESGLADGMTQPHFTNLSESTMVWKYRGQVLSDSSEIHVEVSVTGIERSAYGIDITADASLWKGDLRIYEFKRVGVRISEEGL